YRFIHDTETLINVREVAASQKNIQKVNPHWG
ncbi:MAG: hypothetical protein ACI915_003603, partial [Gammaproteobacteria bacterium]